ncbi:MAG: M42 family metallopeptidase [Candidatus Edwardsbacteria bacterium]
MKDLIKRLTETYGPSGNEEKVRETIKKEIEKYVDETKVDVLGNLIAHQKGSGVKVMLAAHMDEIGVVVIHIDEKGFLRFSNVGGVFPLNVLGQRVVFANGLIGTIGEEKRESAKDELKLEKMFIDLGASNKEIAQKMVKIGDVAAFQRDLHDLGVRLISKAMDDRIGCVVLIETIKQLKKTPNDLYFVFTVQEEVGVRGAMTSTYGISPDIGLAVDITGTGDTPEARTMAVELGKGPAIKVKDVGLLAHPKVKRMMIEIAEREKIPYQLEVLERGATDAWAIHTTKEGVPSGVLSVPTRYVHTPSEMIDLGDVEKTIALLRKILQEDIRKWIQ